MDELGVQPTTAAIASHYRGLIDGLIVDSADAAETKGLDVSVHLAPTLMMDTASKVQLAEQVLAFGARLSIARERASK